MFSILSFLGMISWPWRHFQSIPLCFWNDSSHSPLTPPSKRVECTRFCLETYQKHIDGNVKNSKHFWVVMKWFRSVIVQWCLWHTALVAFPPLNFRQFAMNVESMNQFSISSVPLHLCREMLNGVGALIDYFCACAPQKNYNPPPHTPVLTTTAF